MNNNSYPNASSGMNKLFTAEILNIIGVVPLIIGLILSIAAAGTAAAAVIDGSDASANALLASGGIMIAGTVLLIIGFVIMLISFILQLVGLGGAGRDHIYFKYAFGMVFVRIMLSIGSGIFGANSVVGGILSTAAECSEVIMMILIVYGCMALLEIKGREALVENGFTVVNLMIIVNLLSVLARIMPVFIVPTAWDIAFAVLYGLLSIISGLLFLIFLKKAAKALK